MYKLLLGGLAALAVIAGIYLAGVNHQRKHDAPIIAGWHAAADDYKLGMKRYRDVFHEAEKRRATEARQAITAVDGANAACSDRIAAIRASERALKGLMARPVKVEKGCAVPALWTAQDLQSTLRPGAR